MGKGGALLASPIFASAFAGGEGDRDDLFTGRRHIGGEGRRRAGHRRLHDVGIVVQPLGHVLVRAEDESAWHRSGGCAVRGRGARAGVLGAAVGRRPAVIDSTRRRGARGAPAWARGTSGLAPGTPARRRAVIALVFVGGRPPARLANQPVARVRVARHVDPSARIARRGSAASGAGAVASAVGASRTAAPAARVPAIRGSSTTSGAAAAASVVGASSAAAPAGRVPAIRRSSTSTAAPAGRVPAIRGSRVIPFELQPIVEAAPQRIARAENTFVGSILS